MGRVPKSSKVSLTRTPTGRRSKARNWQGARAWRAQRRRVNARGMFSSKALANKLQALRNLIPTCKADSKVAKPDQLFQETADYILKLRTQVFILQTLIKCHGSTSSKGGIAYDSKL